MKQDQQDDVVLVLGARHVGLALFMMVLMMGTFGAVTYVVGRMIGRAPVAVEAISTEQVLVVESDRDGVPVSAPVEESKLRVAATPKPVMKSAPADIPQRKPSAAPVPVSRAMMPSGNKVLNPSSFFKEPRPGQLFLQVSAADRAVAEVFGEYLTRRGFRVQIAAGPDDRNWRVLVGPLGDNTEIATVRAGLEAIGFHPFLRSYKENSKDVMASLNEAPKPPMD